MPIDPWTSPLLAGVLAAARRDTVVTTATASHESQNSFDDCHFPSFGSSVCEVPFPRKSNRHALRRRPMFEAQHREDGSINIDSAA
jgi:hypothetical protein